MPKQDSTQWDRRERKRRKKKDHTPGPLSASHRKVGPARMSKKTMDVLRKVKSVRNFMVYLRKYWPAPKVALHLLDVPYVPLIVHSSNAPSVSVGVYRSNKGYRPPRMPRIFIAAANHLSSDFLCYIAAHEYRHHLQRTRHQSMTEADASEWGSAVTLGYLMHRRRHHG